MTILYSFTNSIEVLYYGRFTIYDSTADNAIRR